MVRVWIAVAGINGLISVAAGAFGAHALRDRLEPRMLEVFEVGVRYQMYHALALLATAWLMSMTPSRAASAAAWCFLIGIVIFSGSLYVLSLTGIRSFGAVTPVGGVLFIVGWLLMVIAALSSGEGAPSGG
jgi:uncharacterized membrane protein YgdD (TMEM256/DUF423 family)